jgi:hypothetical protein
MTIPIFLEPEFNTGTDTGRILVTVLGMVAEMELKFIRERQRTGRVGPSFSVSRLAERMRMPTVIPVSVFVMTRVAYLVDAALGISGHLWGVSLVRHVLHGHPLS